MIIEAGKGKTGPGQRVLDPFSLREMMSLLDSPHGYVVDDYQ